MIEKVKCERCDGRGTLKKVRGAYYRTKADGRARPRCTHCQGYGFIVTEPTIDPSHPSQDRKATT